jgi:hypothetical protein
MEENKLHKDFIEAAKKSGKKIHIINQEEVNPKPQEVTRYIIENPEALRSKPEVLSSKEVRAELEREARKELQSWMLRFKVLPDLVNEVAKAAGVEPPTGREYRMR